MDDDIQQSMFDFGAKEVKKDQPASEKSAPPVKEKTVSTRGRKSLKEMGEEAGMPEVPADEELYKKQYYSIGEVAQMFKVNGSLLRFWESEFSMDLRKNRKGDRFFKPDDIKTLLMIHDLLRRRKFTIEGAKEYLKDNKKAEEKYALIQSLQQMKSFLLELKANL
jgi:DNA-binding transcriptional MerR regulator